jgi:hypothetical protein
LIFVDVRIRVNLIGTKMEVKKFEIKSPNPSGLKEDIELELLFETNQKIKGNWIITFIFDFAFKKQKIEILKSENEEVSLQFSKNFKIKKEDFQEKIKGIPNCILQNISVLEISFENFKFPIIVEILFKDEKFERNILTPLQ